MERKRKDDITVFTGKYFKVYDPSVSKSQITYFHCLSSETVIDGIMNDYTKKPENVINMFGYGYTVEEYMEDGERKISLFDIDLSMQISFNEFNQTIVIEEISKNDYETRFMEYNSRVIDQIVSHNNEKEDFLDILNG